MRLALRFISGKYQGGEFPLEEDREIIVGRSSDLDMVLVEEMVSRRHARIHLSNGHISIDDLNSTNGTFVNGERVTHAELQEGDRVLIGSNILKVVTTDGTATSANDADAASHVSRSVGRRTEDSRMSGDLEEIPLPDLMQLFGSSRKTATLIITTDTHVGRIHLNEGIVRAVEMESANGDPLPVSGLKAIYRMICWERGVFELTPRDTRTFEPPLDVSVQEVLMEGFRQKDELVQLGSKLPELNAALRPLSPMKAPLRDLSPAHLDIFQAVLNTGSLEGVYDATELPDLEAAQKLLELMQRGYVEASA
jgi:pSer/pThr/pTyr-binding forkhead associated (FHA) protein